MRKQEMLDQLISKRWPKLKERAQNERNPERLIKILGEIDDLLFNVEMRMAWEQTHSKDGTDTGSVRRSPDVAPCGDSEVDNE